MVKPSLWLDKSPSDGVRGQLSRPDAALYGRVESIVDGILSVRFEGAEGYPPVRVRGDGGIAAVGARVPLVRDSSGRVVLAGGANDFPEGADPVPTGYAGQALLEASKRAGEAKKQIDELQVRLPKELDEAKGRIDVAFENANRVASQFEAEKARVDGELAKALGATDEVKKSVVVATSQADNAKRLAEEAKTKADSVGGKVAEAQQTAEDANGKAEVASSIASMVQMKLSGVKDGLHDVKSAADEAKKAASEADSKASAAAKTAGEAGSNATSALQDAKAAKTAADKATSQAENAAKLAGSASEAATRAQTAADGKSKITRSTTTPSGAGHAGDVWWQYTDSSLIGKIIGQWVHDGTAWVKTDVGAEIVADLTVDKLKAGTGSFDRAVIKKLVADQAFSNEMYASRIISAESGNLVLNGDLTGGQAPWSKELSFIADGAPPACSGYLNTDARPAVIKQVHGGTPIRLEPGREYAFTAWVSADIRDSRMFLELRDSEDNHAIDVTQGGPLEGVPDSRNGNPQYLIGGFEIPTEWTKIGCRFRVNPARGYHLGALYVNHSSSDTWAYQAIAGISITPMVGSTLIEGGAITTSKLAAHAVDVEKLNVTEKMGAKLGEFVKVKADNILAGSIDVALDFTAGGRIAGAEVVGSKIIGGQVIIDNPSRQPTFQNVYADYSDPAVNTFHVEEKTTSSTKILPDQIVQTGKVALYKRVFNKGRPGGGSPGHGGSKDLLDRYTQELKIDSGGIVVQQVNSKNDRGVAISAWGIGTPELRIDNTGEVGAFMRQIQIQTGTVHCKPAVRDVATVRWTFPTPYPAPPMIFCNPENWAHVVASAYKVTNTFADIAVRNFSGVVPSQDAIRVMAIPTNIDTMRKQ